MSAGWARFKQFINTNIVLVVTIPGLAGLHWGWQKLQEDETFVKAHERREFPTLTLYKHAKHLVGLGPQPEKHPRPND